METKPMLAHKYEDRRNKIDFAHAYIQPKLDGVRCLAIRSGDKITLLSRQGKPFSGLEHIRNRLLEVMIDGAIWDGELYVHGMPFQSLLSLVKKVQPDSANVEYHVYDTVSDRPFEERQDIPQWAIAEQPISSDPVKIVSTHKVDKFDDVDAYHQWFVERGYEGIMLRWGMDGYKSGYRSEHLLKVKAFMDEEFEIVDVVPGVGKESDKGTFVCKTKDGTIFNCRPRGRDDLRAEYLANKSNYISKMLTVEFFEWTTSENPVPRFPVGKAIRED